MKVAVLYFKLPDMHEPVESGIAVVIKDDADFENAAHLARQALGYAVDKVDGALISGQEAVTKALVARGYKVSICKRMIVERG